MTDGQPSDYNMQRTFETSYILCASTLKPYWRRWQTIALKCMNYVDAMPILFTNWHCKRSMVSWYTTSCGIYTYVYGHPDRHDIMTLIGPTWGLHMANMGPIWGRQDPGEPHVGPVNFAICGCNFKHIFRQTALSVVITCNVNAIYRTKVWNIPLSVTRVEWLKKISNLMWGKVSIKCLNYVKYNYNHTFNSLI